MSLIKLGRAGQKLNDIRKFLMYGNRSSAKRYVRALKVGGAHISDDLYIQTPESVFIDDTTPYMLTIGKNVFIATGVTILTHDACWLIETAQNGRISGHICPVDIGNRVFLGIRSTVLCGVSICDDVIVGANSVVSRSITEPGVYVGNPVRKVADIDAYFASREKKQLDEAYTLAVKYYETFGEKPPQDVLNEYFRIFCPRKESAVSEKCRSQMNTCSNFEQCMENFLASEPKFSSYDEFWSRCLDRMEKEQRQCQE